MLINYFNCIYSDPEDCSHKEQKCYIYWCTNIMNPRYLCELENKASDVKAECLLAKEKNNVN